MGLGFRVLGKDPLVETAACMEWTALISMVRGLSFRVKGFRVFYSPETLKSLDTAEDTAEDTCPELVASM